MFAAQAKGLGSSAMIGFDAACVVQKFGPARDEAPVVLMTVGYVPMGTGHRSRGGR